MSLTLPVRVYDVSAGTSADDPDARLIARCRKPDDAAQLERTLELMRRSNALVGDDVFFVAANDIDIDVGDITVRDAMAQGYAVKSVVLATKDIPPDKVIATVAGEKVDESKAARVQTKT